MKPEQEQKQIHEMLNAFKESVGKPFIIKGDGEIIKTSLTDTILGIDRELQLVIGEKGEFPVAWCKIKKEQKVSLKKIRSVKTQTLFQ